MTDNRGRTAMDGNEYYDRAAGRSSDDDCQDNEHLNDYEETYPDGSLKCECWRSPGQPRKNRTDHHQRERSDEY